MFESPLNTTIPQITLHLIEQATLAVVWQSRYQKTEANIAYMESLTDSYR